MTDIPDRLALNLSSEKNMSAITLEHFRKLTNKAALPEYLVLSTVRETADRAMEAWRKNRSNYALPGEMLVRIEKHLSELKFLK